MSGVPIVPRTCGEAESIVACECKFTIETIKGIGGDFQRNVGGTQEHRRVTFDGYAPNDLMDALVDAIGRVCE